MKEWAPGMIIPRKKAASADDIARSVDREDGDAVEDMWSKKSRELANAKQAKLSGMWVGLLLVQGLRTRLCINVYKN